MTPNDLLTRQDLEEFKKELFGMLTPLLGGNVQPQKWLKNEEVKKMLQVSGGTFQNLRVNGSLPLTKIGGLYYYRLEDVEKMLAGPEKKSPSKRPALRKNKPSASIST